jgi:hypothetical protein
MPFGRVSLTESISEFYLLRDAPRPNHFGVTYRPSGFVFRGGRVSGQPPEPKRVSGVP